MRPFACARGALGLLGSEDDPYRRDELVLGKVYQALKGGGKFVVNALNGCRLIRILSDADVREDRFDPATMTEHHLVRNETVMMGLSDAEPESKQPWLQ
jgi:hypothetical protein